MEVRVKIDIKSAHTKLKLTPSQIGRINRQTANKLVTEIKRRIGGEISRGAGVRVVGFRRVRTFKKTSKTKGKNRQIASVWVGGNNVSARFGGHMRNSGKDAYAGRHLFRNSFKAAVRSGSYTSIWKRLANGKLAEQRIVIDDFHPNVNKIVNEEVRKIDSIMTNELEKVLSSKARRS